MPPAHRPPRTGRAWLVHASRQVEFGVTVRDLPDDAKPLRPLIKTNLVAAARSWADFVDAKPCKIEIVFRLDRAAASGRGSGRSTVSTPPRRRDAGRQARLRARLGRHHAHRPGPQRRPARHRNHLRARLFQDRSGGTRGPTCAPTASPRTSSIRCPSSSTSSATPSRSTAGSTPRSASFPETSSPPTTGTSATTAETSSSPVPVRSNCGAGPSHSPGAAPTTTTSAKPPPVAKPLLKADLMNGIVMQYGQRYDITLLDVAILHDSRDSAETRGGRENRRGR